MTADRKDQPLDAIRREIDAIDGELVESLRKRIAASERVRSSKTETGSLAVSPIRPGREAQILRGLVRQADGSLRPELLVRLWRLILSSSTLAQAPVCINLSKALAAKTDLRIMIAEYFGAMPIEEYDHEAAALACLSSNPGDICVFEPGAYWPEAYLRGLAGGASVIGTVPAIRAGAQPSLLIMGHALTEPTGQDETLVLSTGSLPRDFSPVPLWQVRTGAHMLSCLPGFLGEGDGPLAALMRSNAMLGLRIAGRYPSPIEI